MNYVKHIITTTVFTLIAFPLHPMGEGPQRINSSVNPEFKGVSEREGFFIGAVKEGKVTTELTEISFGGITSLSNILTDKDDSHSTLSLNEISEIKIIDAVYQSPRHTKKPEETFFIKTLVTLHKKDGKTTTSDFLFPSNITISGKERDTDVKKAWRLRDIASLTIKKAEPLSIKKELEKMKQKDAAATEKVPAPLASTPLWKIALKPFMLIWSILTGFFGSLLSFLK